MFNFAGFFKIKEMTQEINNQGEETRIFTLTGGMRCVHRRSRGAVSYIGVAVGAGSRDERPDLHGLAHFVEHTIFKGTENRNSWRISNRMESVGGELNAYTTKEETLVYTCAPSEYTERALELLSDLIRHSTFPEAELTKERKVICEEIKSYLDSPGDDVYDRFEEMIYAGSPMAHNILGSESSVDTLRGTDCRGFIDDFYTSDDMVLYISDPCESSRAERLAEKYFGMISSRRAASRGEAPAIVPQFCEEHNEDGYQAHTLMGVRTFDRDDPRRFPLFLLNNYFGGLCMNSRLNQELRERRGYVYTVESSVALMSDCGLMQIYFGSDLSHVGKCRDIIRRELEKLAESPISSAKFEQIRRQYIGQLLVSTDHRESVAMAMGKSVLYYGEVHDAAWTAERIREVTAEQVREVAETLATRGLSSLTLA